MTGRYRIRQKAARGTSYRFGNHPDGTPMHPYGLWDTVEHRWVNKWGEPDPDYWTCCRDVAVMRRRDLNGYLAIQS